MKQIGDVSGMNLPAFIIIGLFLIAFAFNQSVKAAYWKGRLDEFRFEDKRKRDGDTSVFRDNPNKPHPPSSATKPK
jgi:hypothetical protein